MSVITRALAGYEHVNVIDWAKKLVARHARGEQVSKDALKQAREVLAAR